MALDKGLLASLWGGTWDPANSRLNALISSGHLQLIVDSELQSKLAAWTSNVDEVRDNQITMRNYCSESLWSELANSGAPKVRGWGTQYPELLSVGNQATSEDRYQDIQGNLVIVDLITTKYTWTKGSVAEIENIIREANEIISSKTSVSIDGCIPGHRQIG